MNAKADIQSQLRILRMYVGESFLWTTHRVNVLYSSVARTMSALDYFFLAWQKKEEGTRPARKQGFRQIIIVLAMVLLLQRREFCKKATYRKIQQRKIVEQLIGSLDSALQPVVRTIHTERYSNKTL